MYPRKSTWKSRLKADLLLIALVLQGSFGFAPSSCRSSRTQPSLLFAAIGGGSDIPKFPPGGSNRGNKREDDHLDEFLNNTPESENLRHARKSLSEASLPISFHASPDKDGAVATSSSSPQLESINDESSKIEESPEETTAMMEAFDASTDALFEADGMPTPDAVAQNSYMRMVAKVSPSDLIAKFTASANPRVQEAVRQTILGLIGTLPRMAFETTTVTTGQRLASLMFQLQMTGYMFKNAEYRLSISQSLGMTNPDTTRLLKGSTAASDHEDDVESKSDPLVAGKVKGKLKVRYRTSGLFGMEKTAETESSSDDSQIEVDAAAYMSELRSEVQQLRDELSRTKEAKEEAFRKDLLVYIRTLPPQELQSLTSTITPDVLVCMKGLVQAVLIGMGDDHMQADTVTEHSSEAMAQLCMWQLAVGYNLRELEVREQMKHNLDNLIMDRIDTDQMEGAFE